MDMVTPGLQPSTTIALVGGQPTQQAAHKTGTAERNTWIQPFEECWSCC